ncbi:hypothetical protein AB6A40_003030 [Gnathostoma spinigerum]|uniref:TIMELESS-interacting protein n=1 Tax=Gnathostoma spinigerum TaxID=75299 RepID=A0ABD6EAV1_9BILA
MSMRELSKAEAKSSPHYKIYEFGYHLLKRFFKRLNIVGSVIVPELLFWKSSRECHDIEFGYGSYDAERRSKQEPVILWPENLEDQLIQLYNEFVNSEEKSEGIDVVDFIGSNLSEDRTRRQIIRQMKECNLDCFGLKSKKSRPKESSKRCRRLDEIRSLKKQYEELDETPVVQLPEYIMARLEKPRTRRYVVSKLKILDREDSSLEMLQQERESSPSDIENYFDREQLQDDHVNSFNNTVLEGSKLHHSSVASSDDVNGAETRFGFLNHPVPDLVTERQDHVQPVPEVT